MYACYLDKNTSSSPIPTSYLHYCYNLHGLEFKSANTRIQRQIMPASGVDDIKDQLQVIIDRVATSQNHDDLITAPHIQEQLREIIRNDSDSDNSGSSNDDDESDAVISDDAENIDLDDNDAGDRTK
jgi:hypothetical protein